VKKTPQDEPTLSGRRYSKSGEASRAAMLEEIRKMTPLERMELALSLGRRRRALLELRQTSGEP
jgi:hypothetical protein